MNTRGGRRGERERQTERGMKGGPFFGGEKGVILIKKSAAGKANNGIDMTKPRDQVAAGGLSGSI